MYNFAKFCKKNTQIIQIPKIDIITNIDLNTNIDINININTNTDLNTPLVKR